MTHPPGKPVTVARMKAAAVQDDVRQAEAELHEANEALADTAVGTIVTKESVQAALEQNLNVEDQLHDAVKELQVVTDLLKTAEEEKADRENEGSTLAGRRSGEGVDSVMKHLAGSAKRREFKR